MTVPEFRICFARGKPKYANNFHIKFATFVHFLFHNDIDSNSLPLMLLITSKASQCIIISLGSKVDKYSLRGFMLKLSIFSHC